jgi:hypothetical protein
MTPTVDPFGAAVNLTNNRLHSYPDALGVQDRFASAEPRPLLGGVCSLSRRESYTALDLARRDPEGFRS